MNRNNRSNTVTTTVVSRPAAARLRGNRTTAVTTRSSAPTTTTPTRRARRGADPASSYTGSLHPDAAAYVRCLSNPFLYPPVKLGFGCLTSSQVVTLTTRQIVSAGEDGGCAAYVLPSVNINSWSYGGGLYVSTTTNGAAFGSTRYAWQNAAAVGALFDEARVISCGVRMTPMIPGTSTPGGGFVASLPSTNFATIESETKASIITTPLFEWGTAAAGASAYSRPIDPNSFIFHHNVVAGVPGDFDTPVTIPIIVMNGLPAGNSVLIEAVLQLEGIFGLSAQAQAVTSLQSNNAPPGAGLTRVFNSVESMWNTVSRYLPSPTAVQTAVSLANRLLNGPDRSSSSSGRMRLMP